MNDENREESEGRYMDVDECDYLVDLSVPESDTTELEPNYSLQNSYWTTIHSEKFLLAKHTDRLARAFYIPVWSERNTVYASYSLLERIR